MKVGILSESSADEAGIRTLAERVLNRSLAVIMPVRVKSRGWAAVINNLDARYKALHFNPDADGLIVVLDSDETPPHDQSHEDGGFVFADCRCCQLHRAIDTLRRNTPPRAAGRRALDVAIGLAVPAIEAWYVCGRDVHNAESNYRARKRSDLYNVRRDLKKSAYGFVDAPESVMRNKAVQLCSDVDRTLLERCFPGGFGLFARSLRTW